MKRKIPSSKRIGIPLLLLIAISLPGQEKKTGRPVKDALTFRLPVDVVIVNVTVNDKLGNSVTDLQKGDFRIYDDGKSQSIQTFALESYEQAQTTTVAGKSVSQRNAAENSKATRPRMISLILDDSTITSNEYYPATAKVMIRFVEQDMGSNDRVAILATSGRVHFPFTDDKSTLLKEINELFIKCKHNRAIRCPQFTDLEAMRIFEYCSAPVPSKAPPSILSKVPTISLPSFKEFTEQKEFFKQKYASLLAAAQARGDAVFSQAPANTHINPLAAAIEEARLCPNRVPTNPCDDAFQQLLQSERNIMELLHTLRQHISTLRHFDALKTVIFFSNGFYADPNVFFRKDISYTIQDVVDQALSSGVVINAVDIHGLNNDVSFAWERSEIQRLPDELKRLKSLVNAEAQIAEQASLRQMATDTGGVFHDNNDMYEGIRRAIRRHSSYYIMTYAKPQRKADEKYHRIKVEVARSGCELSYRKGYFAPKEELTYEQRKKEDILEVLQTPDNLNEIPISLAYSYYQDEDNLYALKLSTHVDVHRVHFLDEDSRQKNLINLIVVAYDEMDHYVDGIEKFIDFKLTDSNYNSLIDRGINSTVTFHVPLGRYKIKAIVREGVKGEIGSITKVLEIP
jgi:VWFA-related protein